MAENNYWIENTSEDNHFTKCLWCPNNSAGKGAGWLYPSNEMNEGDKIIHHFNEEEKGFTGESKIKEIRIDIDREELEEKIKEINGWGEEIRNSHWFENYDNFNLVLAEEFTEFDNYLDKEIIREHIGNPPNIEKKLFASDGRLAQWYIRKIDEDIYEKIKKLSSQNITSKKRTLEELEIESLLKKKKQVILYGPPGTGKTYKTKSISVDLLNGDNK